MNSKKTWILVIFLLISQQLINAQLLVKESFKNQFTGEKNCKLINYEIKKEKENIIKTFEVDVIEQGDYYVYAWTMGNKKLNKIGVVVGMEKLNSFETKIEKDNWHFVKITNTNEKKERFNFNKGKNIITFVTKIPEIPQVEFIVLSRNNTLNSSIYDKYIDSLKSNRFTDLKNSGLNKVSDGPPFESSPVYDYDYRMNITYSYTYWTTFYFYAGTEVTLETKKDNPYDSDPVMYLFYGPNPSQAAWAADGGGSGYQAKIQQTVPFNGFYYVIVRSKSHNAGQTSDLWLNGSLYISNIPVSGYYTASSHDLTEELNYFTSHSTGDPRLWIECYDPTHNKLLWFNDNYEGSGNYEWALNARIKKAFAYPSYVRGMLLSSTSSYYPTGTCDLYLRCKNGTFKNGGFPNPTFPNLNNDDVILAHFSDLFTNPFYNCHAWAGGITCTPINPYNDYDNPYWHVDNNPLQSYDNYFGNTPYPRYNGAPNYMRTSINDNDGVIDLWGTSQQNFVHTSIRKPGISHIHGFEWESKNGTFERFFHPRLDIGGGAYGNVLYSYKPASTYSFVSKTGLISIVTGNGYTLEESIASGLSIVENISFDNSEIDKINEFIKIIPLQQFSEYEAKIEEFSNSANLISASRMKELSSFIELNRLCANNKNTFLPLLFQDFSSGKHFLKYIIDALTLPENYDIKNNLLGKYKNIRLTKDGKYIIPNPFAFYMSFIKEVLKKWMLG